MAAQGVKGSGLPQRKTGLVHATAANIPRRSGLGATASAAAPVAPTTTLTKQESLEGETKPQQ